MTWKRASLPSPEALKKKWQTLSHRDVRFDLILTLLLLNLSHAKTLQSITGSGKTPLHLAAEANIEVMQLLLNSGADIIIVMAARHCIWQHGPKINSMRSCHWSMTQTQTFCQTTSVNHCCSCFQGISKKFLCFWIS